MKMKFYTILLASALAFSMSACSSKESSSSSNEQSSSEDSSDTSGSDLHEHVYNDQGLCSCGEYNGKTVNVNQQIVVENVVAGKTYFARVKNLKTDEIYRVNLETTEDDAEVSLRAWATDNETSFHAVDLLNPTGAINYKHVYLAFTPSMNGYDATFSLNLIHNVNEIGYCIATDCGEYVGQDVTFNTLQQMAFDEGFNYMRFIGFSPDDLIMLSFGDREFKGEVTFYTRDLDGKVNELDEQYGIAFLAPAMPDEYLYVVLNADSDQDFALFGLMDMNSDCGHDAAGRFAGKVLLPGENEVPALSGGHSYFVEFEVYADHSYGFSSRGAYQSSNFTWYGHRADTEVYEKIGSGHPDHIDFDVYGECDGVEYDGVVIVIAPNEDESIGGCTITFRISHLGNNLDSMNVCEADGCFDGTEMKLNTTYNFSLQENESEFYRFAVKDGKRYTLNYAGVANLDGFSFHYSTGSHSYGDVALADGVFELENKESEDGYIYIKLETAQNTLEGSMSVLESDII